MIVNTLLSQALICPPQPPTSTHISEIFHFSWSKLEISVLTSWAHMVASSSLFSLNSPHAPHSFTLHSHCPYQFLRHACSPCHRPSMDRVLGKLTTSSFYFIGPTHPSPTIPQGNPQWLSFNPTMYVLTALPDFLLALPTVVIFTFAGVATTPFHSFSSLNCQCHEGRDHDCFCPLNLLCLSRQKWPTITGKMTQWIDSRFWSLLWFCDSTVAYLQVFCHPDKLSQF